MEMFARPLEKKAPARYFVPNSRAVPAAAALGISHRIDGASRREWERDKK